jgi:hypothetical protein
MTYRGQVRNGAVILDDPTALPEGTEVSVRPLRQSNGQGKRAAAAKRPRTLLDVLRPFVGKAKGLPPDMSVNHDHYLYGVPKQSDGGTGPAKRRARAGKGKHGGKKGRKGSGGR